MSRMQLDLTQLQDGLAVRQGERIRPSARHGAVAPGDGVRIPIDGDGLVALTDGLLVCDQGVAKILPARVHRGDIHRGRALVEDGNLIVVGDVNIGSQIVTSGFLVVTGEVLSSQLDVMDSVLLRRGCADSTVSAGANAHVVEQNIQRLAALSGTFGQLVGVLEQLQTHPSFRTVDLRSTLRPLLEVLLERNFASLPLQVGEVLRRCAVQQYLGGAVAETLRMLSHYQGTGLFELSQPVIQQLRSMTSEAVAQLAQFQQQRKTLWVTGPVDAARLQSNGDILVTDSCRGATLKAGNGVEVAGILSNTKLAATQWARIQTLAAGCSVQISEPGEVWVGSCQVPTPASIGQVTSRVPSSAAPITLRLSGDQLDILRQE